MKIVLNGCFDLFHTGHQYLLELALKWSNYGEVLVLINSDDSVRALKGHSRPIENSTQRTAHILEAEAAWSIKNMCYPQVEVKVFDTDTDLKQAIDEFKPDMIIKGSDWPDVREIVGSDRWPVCIVPRLHDKDGDISTTRQQNAI
jgi:D-beta-D-heptose 7-phosphate kinase/D-beta-D-heptose 1-phosphate adenosyltransferase